MAIPLTRRSGQHRRSPLAVELTGSEGATGADLLTAENKPLLRAVLQYHVLTSEVTSGAIPFGKPITSAEGSVFKIESGSPR